MFREERGRLLASLVRQFGDLGLAEEVASDAVTTALEQWPVRGVPAKPAAWLLTTARRKAVDRLRRDKAYAARLAVMQAEAEREGTAVSSVEDADVSDERLRLFFTCCHPALPLDAQTALTLRCLAGLGTPEVARAFLNPRQLRTWDGLPCMPVPGGLCAGCQRRLTLPGSGRHRRHRSPSAGRHAGRHRGEQVRGPRRRVGTGSARGSRG